MSRKRRVVGAITLAIAAYLIVIPFALSLFSRTQDAQHLSDRYRPVMSHQGLGRFRTNLALVNAGGTELFTKFLPEVQTKLGLSKTDFDNFVTTNYPHVAAFLTRVPQTVKYLNPATQRVLAQEDNYASADSFPVSGVPVSIGPWAILFLGLALGAVGWLIFAGGALLPINTTLPTIAVLVVGIGLVAGPLALGWIGKTDAADQVAQAARAPFSVAVSDATVNDTFSFNAAFIEMRTAMFPAVAQKFGMTDTQFDTYVHTQYPALMKFLDKWDASIYQGARALSLSQVQYMDEFHNADSTPYRALPWLFMAPGAVLLVAGAVGLRGSRRREEQTETTPIDRVPVGVSQ